jgi:hypothetical protein
MEVLENLQRLLQLRQAELNGFRPTIKPDTEESVSKTRECWSGNAQLQMSTWWACHTILNVVKHKIKKALDWYVVLSRLRSPWRH